MISRSGSKEANNFSQKPRIINTQSYDGQQEALYNLTDIFSQLIVRLQRLAFERQAFHAFSDQEKSQ